MGKTASRRHDSRVLLLIVGDTSGIGGSVGTF